MGKLHASPLAKKIIEEKGVKAAELAKVFPGRKFPGTMLKITLKAGKPALPHPPSAV